MFKPEFRHEYFCFSSLLHIKNIKEWESPFKAKSYSKSESKYVSLGINIHPNFWDTKKNKPKTNCPNYMAIQRLITDKIKEYTDNIVDLQLKKKELYKQKPH